jgi:predicted AlkP superfamily pyrophosphatase or phosphodiesterase
VRRLPVLLAAIVLAGCSPTQRSARQTLILISIDGFRADYLQWYDAPNLQRLASGGVSAPDGMQPVFPSKTFPNHYSIATGLYPASSGMVANTMYDERADSWFRISDREAVEDPYWWGGEPIWVTAEKQGQVSATYFWVGSEAPIQGIQPRYWYRFDSSVPMNDRVDQALDWMDLPDGERPSLVTLYFEEVDLQGHRHGPSSPEAERSVEEADALIGRLLDGLSDRGLSQEVNLMIVADHGMAATDPEKVVLLDEYLDPGDGLVVDYSPVLAIRPNPGRDQKVREAIRAMPGVRLLSEEVLEDYRYVGHYRIPGVVAIAETGWTIFSSRESWERSNTGLGNHGYDPRSPEMGALFIANGPAFREGLEVSPFENIHLYNLMAEVLGLEAATNDGDFRVVSGFLR